MIIDAVIGYPVIEIIDDKIIQKEMRQPVFQTRQSATDEGTRKPRETKIITERQVQLWSQRNGPCGLKRIKFIIMLMTTTVTIM
jgi:hypothetical protein